MTLVRTEFALEKLLNFLERNGLITDREGFAIEHEPEQDSLNAADPRAFCYTQPGTGVISCTQQVEFLPDRALLGILLHEIGHIELGAFEGDESEIDVDEWCVNTELGYQYVPEVKYLLNNTTPVIATNIEVIDADLAVKILSEE